MIGWKPYRKKTLIEARAYVPGESLYGFRISDTELLKGSPRKGDMIARDRDDHEDQWLIPEDVFARFYEEAPP